MKSISFASRLMVVVGICAIALVGCKKGGDGLSKKEVAAEVGVIDFPTDVLGFVVTPSMDKLMAEISNIGSVVSPQLGPLLAGQIPEMLRMKVLGVGSMTWLDNQKPVRVVVLDHKKFAKSYVFMMPFADKQAFEAAIPPEHTKEGDTTTWKTMGGDDVFLHVLGNYAIFASAKETYEAAKDFIKGNFSGYMTKEFVDIQVSSENLQRVLASEIEALEKKLLEQATDPASGMEESLTKIVKAEIEIIKDLLAQTKVVRLAPAWNQDDLTLALQATVTGEKSLADFVKSAKERKLEVYRHLPDNGWLVAAANLDPKLFTGLTTFGTETMASILSIEGDDLKALTDTMNQVNLLNTGDSAVSILYDGEFPWRIVSINGVTDGVKARQARNEMYAKLFPKLGAVIDEQLGADVKQNLSINWSSLGGVLDSVKPVLAETGVNANIVERKVGDGSIDALEFTIDYSKFPLGAQDPQVEQFAQVMGGKVGGAIGYDKSFTYGAFGKAPVEEIETLFKGTVNSGEPLATPIAQAGFDVAGAGFVALAPLIKAVALITPELAQVAATLDPNKEKAGFTVLLGASGKDVLNAKLHIPLRATVQMFAAGGGMPMQMVE